MPRQVGARNYKNDVLISIISEILPNGEYGWEAVAIAYQEQSREECKRDTNDLKRHWIHNLCKGMKKPTGQPGAANDWVLWCIAIEQKILEKTHSGLLGIPDSDAEEKVDEEEGGGDAGNETSWRLSPAHASKTHANQYIRSQLASSRVPTATVVDQELVDDWDCHRDDEDYDEYCDRRDHPPDHIVKAVTRLQQAESGVTGGGGAGVDDSPFSPSISQSVDSALKRAVELTPTVAKSVKDAMSRAESYAKAQKMKNSSNKNKERASVMGTIIKMLDRMDSSSNDSAMGAQVNLMIMRQLEEMNKGMAQRVHEERHERKKERERRKRRRAKKKAKRREMRASLEDLDDHGGKGSGFWSESSGSESSDSSDSGDSSDDSGYGKGEWRRRKKLGETDDGRVRGVDGNGGGVVDKQNNNRNQFQSI